MATVLNSPDLRADWMAELEEVRGGMLRLRDQLWRRSLSSFPVRTVSRFIAQHRGMFSPRGLARGGAEDQDDFAIYMVGDCGLNIAGLNDTTVPIWPAPIIEAGV